jgi:nitrite reductase (NADH) small subunit
MPLIKVKPTSELPPGSITEVEVNDAPYAVCNIDGKFHCMQGICPHAGGPLGQGTLDGNILTCPWHGWQFDARTGANEEDEDCFVQTYPVVVQDDYVLVDLP